METVYIGINTEGKMVLNISDTDWLQYYKIIELSKDKIDEIMNCEYNRVDSLLIEHFQNGWNECRIR